MIPQRRGEAKSATDFGSLSRQHRGLCARAGPVQMPDLELADDVAGHVALEYVAIGQARAQVRHIRIRLAEDHKIAPLPQRLNPAVACLVAMFPQQVVLLIEIKAAWVLHRQYRLPRQAFIVGTEKHYPEIPHRREIFISRLGRHRVYLLGVRLALLRP